MNRELRLKTTLWHKPSAKTMKTEGIPISCRITVPGSKKTELDTGIRIQAGEWDSLNKAVLPKNEQWEEINQELKEIIADLEAHFRILLKKHSKVTSLMVKNDYKGVSIDHTEAPAKETAHTLIQATTDLIEKFEVLVKEEKRSEETLKQWYGTRKKLKEFLYYRATGKMPLIEWRKGNKLRVVRKDEDSPAELVDDTAYDINLADLDYKFLTDFQHYIMVEREPETLGELAANKQLKNLKQVLTKAVTNSWIQVNPFAPFRSSPDNTDIEPLELDFVEKLYRKKGLIQRLEEVRDAFVFQCFTGFAYQDIFVLGPQHIKKVRGEYWLIKPRGKTGVDEMVPILPVIQELIDKYKNHPYCKANKVLLPIDSNSRYNGYLKEIAVIMKTELHLNTHLARHTFADIMLNLGVPLEVVSSMLGHKSIRTTQRYCKVNKRLIASCMNMIKHKLFNNMGKFRKITKETYEYAAAA